MQAVPSAFRLRPSAIAVAACLLLASCAELARQPGADGAPGAAADAKSAAPTAKDAAAGSGLKLPAPSAQAGASGPRPSAPGTASAGAPVGAAAAAATDGAGTATRTAQAPGPGVPAPAGAAPPGSSPAPAAAAQPQPQPPFAIVVKDATRIPGPLTLWQKDDKVWIELQPHQFNQPFLLSPKIRTGVGEGAVLGGLMAYPINGAGGTQVIEFVRVHNQVRLQARNTDVLAKPGTPEARAVEVAFSHSLLGSTGVASQPHPDRKSVLIDASALFLTDMLGIGMQLQRSFRQGYSLDRGNSLITAARSSDNVTVLETQVHYYSGGVSTSPPIGFGGLPLAQPPTIPQWLPDARSLLVGLHYSLSPLPATPMKTRRADARIGHFASTLLNFSDENAHSPRQRIVWRWRLEKKDPAAEMSEPVKPITFWIDGTVPLAYRETVKSGILEWNKAFEKIGFKDAIVVRQQSDDAPFDTLDMGRASVRWMSNANPWFNAIGPSHIDPRSGEILDADVAIESMSTRSIRAARNQVLAPRALAQAAAGTPLAERLAALEGAAPAAFAESPLAGWLKGRSEHLFCDHALLAGEQTAYALDVLEARGQIAAEGDDREAATQAFVLEFIKDTVMHEVGHALGLRHNFRASRVYTEAQLSDVAFTRANGTSGSVMEYSPVNLARPGEKGGLPFQATLGPYDYWAIEYAYKPLAPDLKPDEEDLELQRIASRSAEPQLAYGSDEDSSAGLDPETLQWDLGADPLAFAEKRLAIARDLFKRQESRILPGDRDYAVLRRSVGYALSDVYRAVEQLARQIGGLRTLRDHPGSGRDPLQPVAADVQRRALDLLAHAVFSADGLTLSPALQRKLAPDYLDRSDSPGIPTDYALPRRLLLLQALTLNYLMSDSVAQRVLDNMAKFDRREQAFRLSELYDRVGRELWVELQRGGSIGEARRELQRDHATRLASAVLRPTALQRADVRSLARVQAQSLLKAVEARLKRGGADAETRAHLEDSAEVLRQALAARVVRPAV